MEAAGSQEQYTERLWQSRTLFRYQDRLPATPPAARGEFGLPEGRHLYVCFQNPLKLHPDFDPLLGGVLEADPQALVVLLADRSGQVARLLKERFARRILPSPPPLSRRERGVIALTPGRLPVAKEEPVTCPHLPPPTSRQGRRGERRSGSCSCRRSRSATIAGCCNWPT